MLCRFYYQADLFHVISFYNGFIEIIIHIAYNSPHLGFSLSFSASLSLSLFICYMEIIFVRPTDFFEQINALRLLHGT